MFLSLKISFALSLKSSFTMSLIFLRLHYSQCFFHLLQEVTTISFVILLHLCHLNHKRMRPDWWQMYLYLQLRRVPIPSAHVSIAVGHCWLPTLNIKIYRWQVAVVHIHWYWCAKYFFIMKKYFLIFWIEGFDASIINNDSLFHKRNEQPLHYLHPDTLKVVKIHGLLEHLFIKV